MVKAGQPARPKTVRGKAMTQYLVAIHHPDDYDPSVAEDEAMDCDIDTLNDEMIAAIEISGRSVVPDAFSA
jgi:hypothetical protein